MNASSWATVSKTTLIPAWSAATIELNSTGKYDTFLSLFDDEAGKIYIPSTSKITEKGKFCNIIENRQNKPITLKVGTSVGRLVDTSDPESSVFTFTADEVESTLADMLREGEKEMASVSTPKVENTTMRRSNHEPEASTSSSTPHRHSPSTTTADVDDDGGASLQQPVNEVDGISI